MRCLAMMTLCLLYSSAWGIAPSPQDVSLDEISKLGKASSVLVVVPGVGEGTAFCIHKDGWFLTNYHVIFGKPDGQARRFDPDAGPIIVVINSGQATEKIVKVSMLRSDEYHDLAILKADEKCDVKPLTLAPSESLNELNEIFAFGFPFGQALKSDRKVHPSISINAGKVTSLRRKEGKLELIQIDAAVNPGNSGGPVLNRKGQVVGIVVAGIAGSGIHFMIPTEYATDLMRRPEISFNAPRILHSTLNKEHEFTAQAVSLDATADYSVTLKLQIDNKPEQAIPMTKIAGQFRAKGTPLPSETEPKQLSISVVLGEDSLNCKVLDTATLRVDDKNYQFMDIVKLAITAKCKMKLRSGEEITGELDPKAPLTVLMGGKEVALDLAKLKELSVTHTTGPQLLDVNILVTEKGKEVATKRHTYVLTLGEGPKTMVADIALIPSGKNNAPNQEKLPVPPSKEAEAIKARLHQLYRNEYARATPKELKALAEKLHEASQGEKNNSIARFVMLTEAIKLSAKAGDLDRSLQITNEINENFKCDALDKLLGEMLADAFGATFQTKELTHVASLELAKPIQQPEVLAIEWLNIGQKMNSNYRVVVFRRARKLTLDAVSTGNINGLKKAELEQLCKIATSQIDKHDSKFRRFSLYEGKWVTKYDNGYIHEYVISVDGDLTSDRIISPDGTPFVKKDEQHAKLTRKGDDVVILFAGGKILERIRLEGEKLMVDRFDPATRYPNSPINKGEGVRENR